MYFDKTDMDVLRTLAGNKRVLIIEPLRPMPEAKKEKKPGRRQRLRLVGKKFRCVWI